MAEFENDLNEEFENYEPELIDLEDEEGKSATFEIIDGMEYDGVVYYAMIPYSKDDDKTEIDDDEFVVLKEIEQNGEKLLTTIDDDSEYEKVGTAFIKRFQEIFAEEEENLQQ